MTPDPERDAQKELEEIFFKVLAGGVTDGLYTPTQLARAALDYFRPVIEVLDVDRQIDNLDLAADEVRRAEREAQLAAGEAAAWKRLAKFRRAHPFRNLWAWARRRK